MDNIPRNKFFLDIHKESGVPQTTKKAKKGYNRKRKHKQKYHEEEGY